MAKIGICFPSCDYEKMSFEEFSKYLLQFKEVGVYSFDFYTSMFLQNNPKLRKTIDFLNQHNIHITLHYHSNKKHDYEDLLNEYKKDLRKVRNVLKIYNINYKIPVVFHALEYKDEYKKHNHLLKLANIFQELSDFSKNLNFEILIETLSHNHPFGNHIGDDVDELEFLLANIKSNNFGICWDIGHTRLNNIENNGALHLTEKIIENVKFTHIHNIAISNNKSIDHLPLTNFQFQQSELEYLVENNYQGIYSIEVETKNIKENILIYVNNIKKINIIIKDMEELYYEFRENS